MSLPDRTPGASFSAVVATENPADRRSRLGLATMMLGMGALHFVRPDPFEKTVPPQLGDARRLVYASGVAEIASGALMLSRRTSRFGGWLAAATMVSVFPANVQMVLDAGTDRQAAPNVPPALYRAVGLARLPLQVPMVMRAVRVARAG